MRRVYTAYGLLVIALYGAAAVKGWDLGSGRKGLIPPAARTAPGGYRSYSYWRGGK
jgi:hypothetical protein